jgi:hypothetical protein
LNYRQQIISVILRQLPRIDTVRLDRSPTRRRGAGRGYHITMESFIYQIPLQTITNIRRLVTQPE